VATAAMTSWSPPRLKALFRAGPCVFLGHLFPGRGNGLPSLNPTRTGGESGWLGGGRTIGVWLAIRCVGVFVFRPASLHPPIRLPLGRLLLELWGKVGRLRHNGRGCRPARAEGGVGASRRTLRGRLASGDLHFSEKTGGSCRNWALFEHKSSAMANEDLLIRPALTASGRHNAL